MRHPLLLVLRAFRPVLLTGGAAHRLRGFVLAAILACVGPAVQGQTPGALDLSFDSGSGVNDTVRVAMPAGNGKAYVGGDFTTVRGALRNRIARLNADGRVDETFNPGTGANSYVQCIAVQANGKVLIGGDFTSYNDTARSRIARLNSDGSLDATFNPATGANGTVGSIVVQPDGKVLIGGGFTSYNGTARNYLARLDSNGSLDTSFDPGTGPNGTVAIALQGDGKVFICGGFTSYNGTARNYIARLNGDGSLDTSFNPGTGPGTGVNSDVRAIAVQADGKVLIGGTLAFARLNSDGSLDTTFNPGFIGIPGSVPPVPYVGSIAVQADGKVLIGGYFTSYNGTPRGHIARFNSDGSLDTGFNPGSGASDHLTLPPDHAHPYIGSVALEVNGKVLISGNFTRYNATDRNHVARLNDDGSPDLSFNPSSSANSEVFAIALQPDGKVLIGGSFTSYNGTARNRIARLNSDGSLDMIFNPGTGADGLYKSIRSIVVQADGKVLIGGIFTSYNGTPRNGIARLNSDGSLDTSFDPGTGANSYVEAIALQADGKVLTNGVARLNSDGSLDTNFNTGTGANSYVHSVAVQANGKVLIGGAFNRYNGTARNGIARLNSNGSLDTSFNPGTGFPYSIVLQADGKILLNGARRLNSDGSLDTSFNPGAGASGYTVALQADGKVLTGGARLNSDGSVDPSFNPGTGANGGVLSVAMQADGRVLIGGWFTSYNGAARSFLVRVANDPATQSILVPDASQVQWLRGGTALEVEQVSFEYSADGASWTALGAGTRINGGWELTSLSLSGMGYLRARGRATGGYYNGSSSVIEQVYAFSDADSDGLLDSWELTYWPTTIGHKASDDFDGDGVPELLELALGLNPTVPDAALQPPVVEEGGYLTITITKHAGAKYEVQAAGSLLSGQPDSFSAESTTILINDASTLKVRDNFPIGVASASRYLRVKVSAAP